jgi:hypothetical protein
MYAELTAALSSVKTISDIATFLLKAKVGSDVTQKAIELQSTIIALQASIMSTQAQNQELMEENERLKRQLAEAENWEEETAKYQLVEVDAGVFVYILHPDHNQADDPVHWLCTNCYQKRQKSILQKVGKHIGPGHKGWDYTCPNCNAHVITFNIPSPTNIEGD